MNAGSLFLQNIYTLKSNKKRKKNMENHFNEAAKDWDKNNIHNERTDAISKEIIKKIETNKKVSAMEFGSGTGLLSFAIQDYFSDITLLDSSIEMTKVAQEKIEQSELEHLKAIYFNLEKQDFNDQTFDCIFSQMALHHVDDIKKMFSKFYKMLNKNGQLFIADLFTEDGTFHDANFTGYYGFDPQYLSELLLNAGFESVEHKECYVIKRTVGLVMEKEFPIFLLMAIK